MPTANQRELSRCFRSAWHRAGRSLERWAENLLGGLPGKCICVCGFPPSTAISPPPSPRLLKWHEVLLRFFLTFLCFIRNVFNLIGTRIYNLGISVYAAQNDAGFFFSTTMGWRKKRRSKRAKATSSIFCPGDIPASRREIFLLLFFPPPSDAPAAFSVSPSPPLHLFQRQEIRSFKEMIFCSENGCAT